MSSEWLTGETVEARRGDGCGGLVEGWHAAAFVDQGRDYFGPYVKVMHADGSTDRLHPSHVRVAQAQSQAVAP